MQLFTAIHTDKNKPKFKWKAYSVKYVKSSDQHQSLNFQPIFEAEPRLSFPCYILSSFPTYFEWNFIIYSLWHLLDIIKIKIFCSMKDTVKRMKWWAPGMEKIFAKDISNERLLSKVCSLGWRVCSCPAWVRQNCFSRFCMHYYTKFVFLFLTYFTLYNRL